MNRLKRAFFLIIILAAASAVPAQTNTEKIEQLLAAYHQNGQLNGTVLVVEKGKTIVRKGYGMANMEWNIPNQPDTKFRIGSVTKQFTAAMILQLVESGKIKLDGRITDYLPDYRKDTGDRVTIHQLLNHTSGIPSYTNNPDFFGKVSRDPYRVSDFVKKFASGDLEYEPGSRYGYNNSGYFLLGAIIEQVTGKSYAENLDERIVKPLGLTGTGYDLSSPLIRNRAAGYQKQIDGYVNAPYLDMSLPYAAGSMYSTVDDLLKWDRALYGEKILKAESKKLMFTPGLSDYGYGFVIRDKPIGGAGLKTKVIQHGGGINGFNCLFTRLVDQDSLIVILDNVGLGQYHGRMTDSIVGILNGQSFELPKKSVIEPVFGLVGSKGSAAAIAEYRRLKSQEADKYEFNESDLNTVGYQLLGSGKTKDAIEIFKLNVEMYPKSSNAYDSLGEAYRADGQKDLAIANYRKSVELDPTNAGGVKAINELEGKTVTVDTSGFESYVGEYQLLPQLVLTITRDGDKLFGQGTGQPKLQLETISETQFEVTAINARITFEKDASGKVTGLTLVQGGRTIKAPKIR